MCNGMERMRNRRKKVKLVNYLHLKEDSVHREEIRVLELEYR